MLNNHARTPPDCRPVSDGERRGNGSGSTCNPNGNETVRCRSSRRAAAPTPDGGPIAAMFGAEWVSRWGAKPDSDALASDCSTDAPSVSGTTCSRGGWPAPLPTTLMSGATTPGAENALCSTPTDVASLCSVWNVPIEGRVEGWLPRDRDWGVGVEWWLLGGVVAQHNVY